MFSTKFHLSTDGQSERVIQILEDMLRACVLDFRGSWSEALYGRLCRSPSCWVEAGERGLLGPEIVQESSEKIKIIRERLLVAQSRQKSYADRRRRPLEFAEGDLVFLKVSPKKGIIRFGKKGKLDPRYVGPFEVVQRIGEVAYRLALPPQLSLVHDVFHVSMLRKYHPDPGHVIQWQEVEVVEDATYEERPIQILDWKEQVLRTKMIPLVKVLWQHHGVEEATWEMEDAIRAKYP